MTTIESLISFFKKILTSSHQDLETGENWKHRASFLNNQIESNRIALLKQLIFVPSSHLTFDRVFQAVLTIFCLKFVHIFASLSNARDLFELKLKKFN